MRHSVLRNHVQKKILLRRNIYRKYISDASNSSDIEGENIKQINTLNMDLVRLFLGTLFNRKKKITLKKEMNVTPQDRISNIDWCKCV